jgi:hypothetical protein
VDYSAPLSQIAEAVLRHHIYEHQEGAQRDAPMSLEGSIGFHHLGITSIDYKTPARFPSLMPWFLVHPRFLRPLPEQHITVRLWISQVYQPRFGWLTSVRKVPDTCFATAPWNVVAEIQNQIQAQR